MRKEPSEPPVDEHAARPPRTRAAMAFALGLLAGVLVTVVLLRPLLHPLPPTLALPSAPPPAVATEPAGSDVASSAAASARGLALIRAALANPVGGVAGGAPDPAGLREAARVLDEARRADALNPEAWFGAGWAAQLAGDRGAAEPLLRRAALLAAGDAKWREIDYFASFDLGVLYRDTDRPEEALAAFKRAADLKPDEASARAALSRARLVLGLPPPSSARPPAPAPSETRSPR